MVAYVSVIHREKSGFGVSFPDFPGCVAVGESFNEAVRQGCEALAFHVEGLTKDGEPIPLPRPIDAIKGDPELANWLDGADLMLIPLKNDQRTSQQEKNDDEQQDASGNRGH